MLWWHGCGCPLRHNQAKRRRWPWPASAHDPRRIPLEAKNRVSVEASHNTNRYRTSGAIRVGLLLLFLNIVQATVISAENALPVVTAEDVVNRMLQADEKRLAEFQGYTATRRYSLENKRVNKSAEILVRVTCTSA